MAERNLAGFNRESNFYRDRMLERRAPPERFPSRPREDVEREAELRKQEQETPFLRKVGLVALVAGGTYMLGRRLPRDPIRKAAHLLGIVGQEVSRGAREAGRMGARGVLGAFPEYQGIERAFHGSEIPELRNLELIDVLTDVLDQRRRVIGSRSAGFAKGLRASKAGGPTRGFDQIVHEHIANKFLRSHPSHGRLRNVTVGEVFAEANLQNRIGEAQFKVLGEARAAGLINDRMALTSGGDFAGLFRDEFGQIVDSRWLSPSRIAKSGYNALRNFQILGFRPVELFANLARPWSGGEFFGELGAGTVIGRDRTLSQADGLAFFMGGKVYRQAGHTGFQELTGQKPFKLFKAREGQSGGLMEAFQALVGAHPLQHRALGTSDTAQAAQRPLRQFWRRLQDLTGVGPGFKTQPHAFERVVLDPLKRARAVREGGRFVPYSEDTAALLSQKGYGFGYIARRDTQRGTLRQFMDQAAGRRGEEAVLHSKTREATTFGGRFKNTVSKLFGLDDGDELAAMFGRETRGTVVTKKGWSEFQKTGTLRHVEKAVRRPPTSTGFGTRPTMAGDVMEAALGRQTGYTTVRNYVTSQGILDSVALTGNVLTMRLNDLLSTTLNYGFRPGEGFAGPVMNLARIYAGYKALDWGVDYLEYGDYLAEKYTGLSPKKAVLNAYVHGRTALQKLREYSGVTKAANEVEEVMPGAIDSPLSSALRFGLPVAATMLKGRGTAMAGLAGGIFFGLGDISQDSKELYDQMIGEEDVAYRRGRWWMLGRQPFGGGQIDYFGKSWIARQLSDYQYTDVQYGDKNDYWANVASTPTPTNLFGILADPEEYMTHKHYFTRPYPFDHEGKPSRMADMIWDVHDTERDVMPGAAARVGMGELQGQGTVTPPTEARSKVAALTDKITELGGIYKFALWSLPGFEDGNRRDLATPDAMSSGGRAYYDNQLGGMLGMTEAYRRFVPDEKWSRASNTIPNMMPNWLPGIRSTFERDQRYFQDFTLGDPFTKIKHGEARLPGPGYEALHRLHSGQAGRYDPMDRFLILADVAPYSESYQHYKAIVQGWAKAGVLDSYWRDRFETTLKQVSDKLERYEFSPRRFTGVIDADPEELAKVKEWSMPAKVIGGAWEVFTHDFLQKTRDVVPLAGPILGDKLAPIRSPLEMYERWELYGEDFADWRTPYKSFIRPKFHELKAQDPATATAGGAMLGIFGANPLSKLVMGTVGAAMMGTASGVRAVQTGQLEGGYIPGHRQRERDAVEYLDHIKYVKYRRMQLAAQAAGDMSMGNYYRKLAGRTVTGLNYDLPLEKYKSQARAALPKRERAYFDAFTNVVDPAARGKILEVVPEHLRPVYVAAWSKMGDPQARMVMKNMQLSADQRAAQFFASNPIPDDTWAGWHPSVSQSDIAIRIARQEALDLHRFNLWEEQIEDSMIRFPDLGVPVNMTNLRRPDFRSHEAIDQIQYLGMNIASRPWSGFQADGVEWDVIPGSVRDALHSAAQIIEGG